MLLRRGDQYPISMQLLWGFFASDVRHDLVGHPAPRMNRLDPRTCRSRCRLCDEAQRELEHRRASRPNADSAGQSGHRYAGQPMRSTFHSLTTPAPLPWLKQSGDFSQGASGRPLLHRPVDDLGLYWLCSRPAAMGSDTQPSGGGELLVRPAAFSPRWSRSVGRAKVTHLRRTDLLLEQTCHPLG